VTERHLRLDDCACVGTCVPVTGRFIPETGKYVLNVCTSRVDHSDGTEVVVDTSACSHV